MNKFGCHAKEAAAEYTPNPIAGRRKDGENRMKDQSAWGKEGRRAMFLSHDAISAFSAVKQLQACQAVKLPKLCPHCKGRLGEPTSEKRRPNIVNVRCTRYCCHKRMNIMRFSLLAYVIVAVSSTSPFEKYSRPDGVAPPVDAGCGRLQALQFTKMCRAAEAHTGRILNSKGKVGGDVEVDVHQVAKVHVSPTNPVYNHLMSRKHREAGYKYFLLCARVAGVVQRGCGKFYLSFMPFHHLLPPRSPPPPESYLETEQCDILDKIRSRANVHIDGNKSWPKLILGKYKAKQFRIPSVAHKTNQFTKGVRGANHQGGKDQTGIVKIGWHTMHRPHLERG